MNRRELLFAGGRSLLFAPAIVRAASLMAISMLPAEPGLTLEQTEIIKRFVISMDRTKVGALTFDMREITAT